MQVATKHIYTEVMNRTGAKVSIAASSKLVAPVLLSFPIPAMARQDRVGHVDPSCISPFLMGFATGFEPEGELQPTRLQRMGCGEALLGKPSRASLARESLPVCHS
jgi:hypothetical protein